MADVVPSLAEGQRLQQLAMEGLRAQLSEGQRLQQLAMEGIKAELDGRMRAVERQLMAHGPGPGPTTIETLVGLSLAALEPDETFDTRPSELAGRSEARDVARNLRVLRALEWQTRHRLDVLDDEGVLQVARAAADWSCMRHPGLFASPDLETALSRAGRRLLQSVAPWSPQLGARRVLHVLTVASDIGGHTRLAERWMRFDTASLHSVVLTEQGSAPVPERIVAAATGGVRLLDGTSAGDQVRSLASAALEYDLVVLHIHPYDTVAVAAFADATLRPPTVLVDHGDHIFWLGVLSADRVVSVRPSAAILAQERRAIPADRIVMIPLPLDPVVRSRSRHEAKQVIGVDGDAILAITIAAGHKYTATGEKCFASAVGEVLSREPRCVLIAVGPDAERADWSGLVNRFGPRARVVPATRETTTFLEAADLYLDSFPFGSPTSYFEACLYGLCALSLDFPGAGVLAVQDADVELLTAGTVEEWIQCALALLSDSELRDHHGKRLAHEIAEAHGAERVGPMLDSLISSAPRVDAPVRRWAGPTLTSFDIELADYQLRSGLGRRPEHLLESYGLLPQGLG